MLPFSGQSQSMLVNSYGSTGITNYKHYIKLRDRHGMSSFGIKISLLN